MEIDYSAAHQLDLAAARHPNRTSLIAPTMHGYQTWTVARANHDARALAALFCGTQRPQIATGFNPLRDETVKPGDTVMIIAHNSPWHMMIYAACARIGAVVCPVSWRLTVPEIAKIASIARPSLVITEAGTRALALAAAPYAAQLRLEDLPELVAKTNTTDIPPAQHISADTPSALLFTSGSSGFPKGVRLTAGQMWWAWQNFRVGFEYHTGMVNMAAAPFSHVGGFNGTTNDTFIHGGTLVVEPDFRTEQVLKDLQYFRVNIMFGVPTMYQALIEHPAWDSAILQNFTRPLVGGAPPSTELITRLRNRGLNPINVYGLTETGGAGICASPDITNDHPQSVGQPFPYVEARLVDADNPNPHATEVPDGTEGMLLLRGPGIITGYHESEGNTERRITDGWLITGDIAARNNGIYNIIGRADDTIISGGENIHPTEIENALLDLPEVADCIVVGTPDRYWGEIVTALIVPEDPDFAPTLENIQTGLKNRVARFKLPRRTITVDKIPLNSNGKPDRQAAKKLAGIKTSRH